MSVKRFLSFVLILFISFPSFAAKKVRIHTIGDSTMEQQNPDVKDQRGWVQMLESFFTDELIVVNPAKSGTSTKTYYRNGYWAKAKKNIQPGDFVLIQFGHNDEKHNGKDGDTGTFPTDSFRVYLTKYVQEVREIGANPILCSPVVRKMFDKTGKQLSRRGMHDLGEVYKQSVDQSFDSKDTFTLNYPANMKFVAKELKCPLIDMTALTAKLVEVLGNVDAGKYIYNLPGDGTHFGANGALLFSKAFVDELKHQNLLISYLKPEKKLITNPANITINGAFVGTECRSAFDVGYLQGSSKSKSINLEASSGFQLKLTAEGTASSQVSLQFPAISGNAVKLYVIATPEKAGELTGDIKITSGSEIITIPVKVNAQSITNNQPLNIVYKLETTASAETKGPVLALEEVWNGMQLINFGAPAGGGEAFGQKRVQNNNISGSKWPENEIDVVYSRYIQFGVKSSAQVAANLTRLDLYVGGGANFRIMASSEDDFSNAFTIDEAANVQSKEMKKYSFPLSQTVPANQKLYIRIYPWSNKLFSEQAINLHDLRISGVGNKK